MIDWQRVVNNLYRHGSLASHARAVGCHPATIHALHRGAASPREPKLPIAIRLLDLHYDLCPELHRPEVIGEP